MASDSVLIEKLRCLVSTVDLSTTTISSLRRNLEEDLGLDLANKKAFIREQVDILLRDHLENAKEPDEEVGERECEQDENARDDSEEKESGDDPGHDEEESSEESARKPSDTKKRRGGFTKLASLSPQLRDFVGVPEMARTQVVKQIWTHIKENNLQDPNNKRKIICDESLRAVFNVDSMDMFRMNKLLAKHIYPLETDEEDVADLDRPRKKRGRKKEREKDQDMQNGKEKRQKREKSGFLAPMKLSDSLTKFLDTGEHELSRSDVVKRMWEYIKQNNLQDPSDKRSVICDDKLKELLDVDRFHGFSVMKLLSPHLSKP